MTVAVAVAVAVFAAWVALGVRRQNQLDRRWRLERERIAARDERRAAANGRPHGDIVAVAPARHEDRQP